MHFAEPCVESCPLGQLHQLSTSLAHSGIFGILKGGGCREGPLGPSPLKGPTRNEVPQSTLILHRSHYCKAKARGP